MAGAISPMVKVSVAIMFKYLSIPVFDRHVPTKLITYSLGLLHFHASTARLISLADVVATQKLLPQFPELRET